ncbi:MAG TPA: hypothetical protein VLT86_09030 [Vicinamibacterales bacterium]|nr:hypothetical protein [Vicinamibacterales bacterium]
MTFLALALVIMAAPPQTPAARDALIRARTAYNAHRYDEAIAAADEARNAPDLADEAAVVLARARLERYHASDPEHRDASDLDAARDALKAISVDRLAARDYVDYLVGLGESLFYEQPPRYGAAAETFALALARAGTAAPDLREPLFEWWAQALDREAQFEPESGRKPLYERILRRAEDELARDDRSVVAMYWVAAAARGADDPERALGAAISAWIRAGTLGSRGETLRTDLDRLVTDAILPERARQLTPVGDAQSALVLLRAQWAELKKRWAK